MPAETDQEDSPAEAELDELVLLLPQILRAIRRDIGGVSLPEGLRPLFLDTPLGPRHIPALVFLYHDGPMGVGELAGRLGVGLTAASQMVGDLDRVGLVERRQDEADRRRTIVDIAAAARSEVARWVETRERPMRRTLAELTPLERMAFLKGLRILRRELSDWG